MESADLARVRKEGVYKKLKTSKKKYFILREKAPNGHASLEYYDSEKKVKPDAKPKRSVWLDTCLSINAKFDAKNPYTLVLFTEDDCLGMVFEREQEQQEWLKAMQDLLSESGDQASKYDHMWQVVVKPEGLASGKTLQAGTYRLCLSEDKLILIPVTKKLKKIKFQLATIRKVAHKKTFFMLESGRNAATGEGELWMQVEDSVVAHNIHDTVLKAIRNNPGENITLFRGRSHTHGTSERPHRSSTKRNSVDGASTLPRHQKARSMHVPNSEFTTSPSLKRQSHSPHKTGSVHMRPKSSFVDFSTVSPGQSPHIMSPLSQEMRDRTDSWGSRTSYRTESSSISEDCETDQSANFPSRATLHPASSLDTTDYLSMNTASSSSKALEMSQPTEILEGYMEMSSPVSSAPCLKTLAASPITASDSGYLDMQPVAAIHKIESSELLRPDKVPSLLSDSESVEEFPKRTYSLGSKPPPIQPTLGQSSAYMDMQCSLEKVNPKTCSAPHLFDELTEIDGSYPALSSSNVSHSSSRSATPCGIPEQREDLMELNFDCRGTGSRESLSDFRSRTSSGSSRDIGYHTSSFEADFRDRTDSSCSRDSAYRVHSIDKFRNRTQTVCQDSLRTHASNLGIEENMRPRSYSHGTSRFRELSKRLKEKTQRHLSSDHAKLTKRFSKNPSRESIHDQRSSMADSEYIDINVVATGDMETSTNTKATPSEKTTVKRIPDDEYMVISPDTTGDADTMHVKKTSRPVQKVPDMGIFADPPTSVVKMRAKPPKSRKETSFKHSSSSESVSSSSSSDLVAKGNKMISGGGKSLSPVGGDYYELQPGSGDAYMKFTQVQPKPFSVPLASQKACSEDSYSVMNPRDTQGNVYNEATSEPTSLGEILQGLDKVVSPIREEDNEALFGPKPTSRSADAMIGDQSLILKHEYVNVNYDDNTKTRGDVPKPKGSTSEPVMWSVKEKLSDNGDKCKKSEAPRAGDLAWTVCPLSTAHEYCEIDFKEKDGHTNTSSTASDTTGPDKQTEQQTSAFDRFKSKTSGDTSQKATAKPKTLDSANTKQANVTTPAPFELLPLTPPSSGDKKKTSPPPQKDQVSSLDVFNLGASPSASSTPVRPTSGTSDLPDKIDPELTSNKSPTLATVSNGNPLAHRGSVTSVGSVESITAPTRLRSHNSQTCLSSMDKASDRLSYQEPSGREDAGDMIRRQSSQVSLSSIEHSSQPLNYATLDLSGSQDESSFPQFPSSEQVSPGIKTKSQLVSKMAKPQDTKPISYAQIDFEQCNISSAASAEKDKV